MAVPHARSRARRVLDVGRLVAVRLRATRLDDAVRAAYDAPFPDEAYKAGPRAMPLLVPTRPDDPATEANRAAWEALAALASSRSWSRSATATRSPAAMAPILRGRARARAGLDHPVLEGAGPLPAGGRRRRGSGEVVARFVQGV